eukprot:1509956-Amphidinium_carterae.1
MAYFISVFQQTIMNISSSTISGFNQRGSKACNIRKLTLPVFGGNQQCSGAIFNYITDRKIKKVVSDPGDHNRHQGLRSSTAIIKALDSNITGVVI